MFNFASFKTFFAVAVIIATVGAFWLQDAKIKNVQSKAKNLQAELQQCKSEKESKEFEIKWANEFSNALNADIEVENENNKTNSNTSFYDTF